MDQGRSKRVMDNLRQMGLSQALFCDPLSIWYLTGYYTEPLERFLALYLSPSGSVLFANRLFPDATGAAALATTAAKPIDSSAWASAPSTKPANN